MFIALLLGYKAHVATALCYSLVYDHIVQAPISQSVSQSVNQLQMNLELSMILIVFLTRAESTESFFLAGHGPVTMTTEAGQGH